MANRNQKKPLAQQVAGAALRGASRGGGLIGSVAGAVRTGIGTVQNVRSGMQTYDKNQQMLANKKAAKKPVANRPVSTAPKNPIAPQKPVNKPVAKPPVGPTAKPTVAKKPKPVATKPTVGKK